MIQKNTYRMNDRMSDLIGGNFKMLLVLSRFGLKLGFGEHTIREVCQANGVDAATFLAVVNFLCRDEDEKTKINPEEISISTLIEYLRNSHRYFLEFKLPEIRAKLMDAIKEGPKDVVFVIEKYYDEYYKEVQQHMNYEEKIVFPYVANLSKGILDKNYQIGIFSRNHDRIEMKISELKNILIKYYPAQDEHLLHSVLFDFFVCEQDLASHNTVEDYMFIPLVLCLEKKLKDGKDD